LHGICAGHDDQLAVMDVLREAKLQVPIIDGIVILRVAARRLPRSNASDTSNMLDMRWRWPQTPTAPAAELVGHSSKHANLPVNMSDNTTELSRAVWTATMEFV
jgi:hypothetical protein